MHKGIKILGFVLKKGTAPFYIFWAVIVLAAIYIFKYVRTMVLEGKAQLFSRVDGTANAVLNNPTDANTARSTSYIAAIVNTIKEQINAFNQDEKMIVDQLNSLLNAQEVSIASQYYKQSTGRSLKADVVKALDSDTTLFLRHFANGTWKDLSTHVKNNLY